MRHSPSALERFGVAGSRVPLIGSGKRTASDDRPQVRPIGTLTEPAAEQQSVKVAHGAAVNLSCVSTSAVEMQPIVSKRTFASRTLDQ
jgi:hypothetical protein